MSGQFARFLLTGFANSALGWAIILACLWAGAGGLAANMAGYGAGLALSFTLNRRFVFGVTGDVSGREVMTFLFVFLIAYGANLAVLLVAQPIAGDASIVAQVPAVATYVLTFFLLSRRFVFRREGAR
ncbi:MAG: hypothetical protein GC147_08925 [Porphyrobacter sp.]|nr:hypothetical protein [Porphyrobacter sp.]